MVRARRAGRFAARRKPCPPFARRAQVRCSDRADVSGAGADAQPLRGEHRRGHARVLQHQAVSANRGPRDACLGQRDHRRLRSRDAGRDRYADHRQGNPAYQHRHPAQLSGRRARKRAAARAAPRLSVAADGLPVARIALSADHITRRGEPRHKGFVAGDPKGTLWSQVSEIARNAAPDARPGPV